MTTTRRVARLRRHRRVRKKLFGTPSRPRLVVFRSARHISAQLVDDIAGHTLVSVSTTEASLRNPQSSTEEGAKAAGELLAERAKAAGIATVVFDRGGYKFHGRVAALAEAAREAGLKF